MCVIHRWRCMGVVNKRPNEEVKNLYHLELFANGTGVFKAHGSRAFTRSWYVSPSFKFYLLHTILVAAVT